VLRTGDDQRRTVCTLIKALIDRGFVREIPPPTDSGLTDALLERFTTQINFIEHFTRSPAESPARRFNDFRRSRVLVAGDSTMVLPAVRGLIRNGMARSVTSPPATGRNVESALRPAQALEADGVPARCRRCHGHRAGLRLVVYARVS